MSLDRRNRDFNTPAIKPISCFADIENLPLLHQGQDELIRNSVASAIRTISLFPWAMTLNALCSTDTNKTIHRDHQFVVVPDPSWAACDGGSHRHLTASANEAGCLVDWENRVKVRSDDAFGASRSYLPILPKTLAEAAALLATYPYSPAVPALSQRRSKSYPINSDSETCYDNYPYADSRIGVDTAYPVSPENT